MHQGLLRQTNDLSSGSIFKAEEMYTVRKGSNRFARNAFIVLRSIMCDVFDVVRIAFDAVQPRIVFEFRRRLSFDAHSMHVCPRMKSVAFPTQPGLLDSTNTKYEIASAVEAGTGRLSRCSKTGWLKIQNDRAASRSQDV